VDHREGGPPITPRAGSWFAIDVVHVTAERIGAGLSAYESLIEQARTSSAKARTATVLRSANDRRVVALVEIGGHDAFSHLKSAWDDHHLSSEHRAVAESSALGLYQVAADAGESAIDPGSTDAYAFERVARAPQEVRALIPSASSAAGFVGLVVFGTSDGEASAILYRFHHRADLDAFRAGPAATKILGNAGSSGESAFAVRPAKTFGG
jgi:hypothetical protein